jgi:hypothetical protein
MRSRRRTGLEGTIARVQGGRRLGCMPRRTGRAPVVHRTHWHSVCAIDAMRPSRAAASACCFHPCACAHGTKVHVNFEWRSHTTTKPRNKVQLAARPLQRRSLRARPPCRTAPSPISITRPELGHLVHRLPLGNPLSSHSTVRSIRAHRSSMELRADDEGARGSCKWKKRRWKGCAGVTAPARGGDGKSGAWALPRRCAWLVREQRARLYIARRCVSMLALQLLIDSTWFCILF